MAVAALDPLLSEDGWAYASLPPQEPGDPGRFHALFGRDALITALQVLPEAPAVAVATLRALAALQGRADDPATDEEPGKILHEYRPVAEPRFAAAGWPVRDGELRYYGSADSTSWFLVVLAALEDDALAAELADARRAAGAWLARALDAGGGLVRYGPRRAPGGLAQQGWRDAIAPVERHPHGAGIVRPDGSAPAAPLADADCQAVAVAALDALARLDPGGGWEARAAALRARVPPLGPADWRRVADGDRGRRRAPCRARARSSAGCCGRARWRAPPPAAAAERLARPDVLTPFGLRTLSAAHGAFRAARLPPRRRLAVRLLARLGRPARGRARRPRPSGSARACSPRSTGSGSRRSSTRSARRAGSSRCRSPTASRPGRSARAGRSSTAGTAASVAARRLARRGDLEHDLDVALDPRVGERHLRARRRARTAGRRVEPAIRRPRTSTGSSQRGSEGGGSRRRRSSASGTRPSAHVAR